jgi:hypothetical protein
VPGPPEYLYIKGARLEELHPISTLPAGNLLNITLFSYAGQLFFGLIATDELPNLERLRPTSAKPSPNSSNRFSTHTSPFPEAASPSANPSRTPAMWCRFF